MAVIKPDAKSVQKILADKSTQIDSFLVAKNITFENEEDLKKVVDFYNTL
jgi:phage gp36-like protein